MAKTKPTSKSTAVTVDLGAETHKAVKIVSNILGTSQRQTINTLVEAGLKALAGDARFQAARQTYMENQSNVMSRFGFTAPTEEDGDEGALTEEEAAFVASQKAAAAKVAAAS